MPASRSTSHFPNSVSARIRTSVLASTALAIAVVSAIALIFEDSPLRERLVLLLVADAGALLLCARMVQRSTRESLQPIRELSAAAQRVSEGELAVEVPVPVQRDEIALLANTFNLMVRQLRAYNEHIEAQNRELMARNAELQSANEVLAQLSITDGLTKLHNHRHFQDLLVRESRRAARTNQPLSLLLIDIDDFKQLNDRHGHTAGDRVLSGIAGVMNLTVRETDLLARYGGEEFVVLCIDTSREGACVLAEKLRMEVERARFEAPELSEALGVSVSVGVAELGDGDHRTLFRAADRALYRAKAAGKNCIVADVP